MAEEEEEEAAQAKPDELPAPDEVAVETDDDSTEVHTGDDGDGGDEKEKFVSALSAKMDCLANSTA